VFLVADDDDWPKEMYAKLGFEEAGRTFQFLLKPADIEKGAGFPAPF
jgi:hypothetical protein